MTTCEAVLDVAGRMHRMGARISRAMLRAEGVDSAYDATCRFAVESGLFDLAWIGQFDPIGARVRPIARHGAAATLVGELAAAAGSANSCSPAAVALRTGRPAVCNDLATPEHDWPARAAMRSAGMHAVAAFPLRDPADGVGVFELYAGRVDRFDADVLALLGEIVDDLAFALGAVVRDQQLGLAAATRVHYLAYYNPQTGLPNRSLLEQRVRQLASEPRRSFSLLSIRLERLDAIARAFGSAVVDELLRNLAERLERECGNELSMLAQIASDEFAIVLPDVVDVEAIRAFSDGVAHALSQPRALPGAAEAVVGASVGVVRYPLDEAQAEQSIARARTAAMHAPPGGAPCFYEPAMDHDSAARLALEAELHHALARGEFHLVYQPQVTLSTGAIVGVEALLRWRHPSRGLLAPARFVQALEQCGLMSRVGDWVLRTACAQSRSWIDAGLPPVRMSVNVSAQQIRFGALVDSVREALAATGAEARHLDLELTEGLVLDDAERAIEVMHGLKALGVELSLDDFGTGYSSLSYLRRFPIDRLKIDQSFVCDVGTDPDSATLVRAILAMASSLGLTAVAEGVETEAQLGYLRKFGCPELQGYLFSPAVDALELAEMLQQDRKLPVAQRDHGPGSTVLVVDDEPGIQAALKRVLRRDGITVLTAHDAREGLELLARTDVGVIVCDQRMPGTSGAEFLGVVKALYPQSIRILLTGYTEVASLLDAVNRGAVSKILTKPWEDDQLRANVSEALRHYEAARENLLLSRRIDRILARHPDYDEEPHAAFD